LATMTRSFIMSPSTPPDFQNKEKWPTRITVGAGAAGMRSLMTSAVSLLRYFNWTTVVLVCDGPGNSPISCNLAQVLKATLISALKAEVEVITFDGSVESFDYLAVLQIIKRITRGKCFLPLPIYSLDFGGFINSKLTVMLHTREKSLRGFGGASFSDRGSTARM
ncbi:hypothetical protein RvY_16715, partial [Ramazzottius varieornatus]